jgi:hypothetical protein
MRSRAQPIGTVAAPDREAAEAEAVRAFVLSEDQALDDLGEGLRPHLTASVWLTQTILNGVIRRAVVKRLEGRIRR